MARYVLLEKIGQGGMAEVYRTRAIGSDGYARRVAVKRLLPEFELDDAIRARFVDEARIARRLRHPCIVGMYDYYEEAGRPHLVMELVDGAPLAELIARARSGRFVPLAVSTRILHDVARALEYAHGEGVLHRDVSSANVLVSRTGVVKLADFGIAQARERLSVSEPGAIFGNPAYMSPSRRVGAPATAADDLYALGVVLGELLVAADPRERSRADGQLLKAVQSRLVSNDPASRPTTRELVAELGQLEPANNRAMAALLDTAPSCEPPPARKRVSITDLEGDTYPEAGVRPPVDRPRTDTHLDRRGLLRRSGALLVASPLRLALVAATIALLAAVSAIVAHALTDAFTDTDPAPPTHFRPLDTSTQ